MSTLMGQALRTYGYLHRIALQDLWVPHRIGDDDL
jgi:hypothetical protein